MLVLEGRWLLDLVKARRGWDCGRQKPACAPKGKAGAAPLAAVFGHARCCQVRSSHTDRTRACRAPDVYLTLIAGPHESCNNDSSNNDMGTGSRANPGSRPASRCAFPDTALLSLLWMRPGLSLRQYRIHALQRCQSPIAKLAMLLGEGRRVSSDCASSEGAALKPSLQKLAS